MNILVLTQVYYPDPVAVAQHLDDFCTALADKGHSVKVITSRHNYEHKKIIYPTRDKHGDVEIIRVKDTGFGKGNILYRLIDFFSYYFLCGMRTAGISRKKYDLIVGLTSPPLLSYMGSFLAKLKGIPFLYWIMDLQPELSIHTGLIKESSLLAKLLSFLGKQTFKRSSKIVALDAYMKEYVVKKDIDPDKIEVVPVWPVMQSVYTGSRENNPFRIKQKFGEKIVIMYSGNHSYVHPLTTVLEAAKELENNDNFLFVFIGEGVGKKEVAKYKVEFNLDNVIQLPFEMRENIHISLGSSDIQLVVMGDKLSGYTHPNKIYGAMFVGKPILYIGPDKSHIADIFKNCPGNISVLHGDVSSLVNALLKIAVNKDSIEEVGKQNRNYAVEHFEPSTLINKMVKAVESCK